MSKSQLGQFYTTNYEYILSNMMIPRNVKTIVEPFVGNGDLLNFIQDKKAYKIETYDIEPKTETAIKRDTLADPPEYKNKFILTNPPYLARNKNKKKELYEKYNCNDLYKCFLIQLLSSVCQGGIIIIPLNFICSIRKADVELRRAFVETYSIKMINIFEERVFEDTSYTVCSMFFEKRIDDKIDCIKINIYPSKEEYIVNLTTENNYTIGGEIYNLKQNPEYMVKRATKQTKKDITNILLKCIDDNANNQLGFRVVSNEEIYIDNTPNLSARSYATLVINKSFTLQQQQDLVNKMNSYLNEMREKYHSLFLCNYRESNSIARKRISFDLAFKICNYCLS